MLLILATFDGYGVKVLVIQLNCFRIWTPSQLNENVSFSCLHESEMWVSVRHCSSVSRFPFKPSVASVRMISMVSSGTTEQFQIEKQLFCCILVNEGSFVWLNPVERADVA